MAIKLPCPRCKKPLAVPNKKAGSYVNCPLCNGRLWVPKDSQADAAHLDEVVATTAATPPAPPEAAAAGSGSPAQIPLPPAASPATLAKVLSPPGANAPVNSSPIAAGAASGGTAAGALAAGNTSISGPAGVAVVGGAASGGAVPGAVVGGGSAGSGSAVGGSTFGNAAAAGPAASASAGYGPPQPLVAPQSSAGAQSPIPPQPPGYRPTAQPIYSQNPPVAPPVVGPAGYPAKPTVSGGAAGPWPAGDAPSAALGVAPAQAAPPQPPPVAAQTGAVAAEKPRVPRFISAEAALSRLQLASDGRLPQLQLHESAEEPKQKQQSRSVNPLLLFALLGASVLASILMVLADTSGGSAQQGRSTEEAWQIIEAHYFGDPDKPQRPQRYQELLRDAQRARNRGDIETQNKLLREVLAMLDAEPHPNDRGRGLTGSPGRDKRLRQQIIVLLREK